LKQLTAPLLPLPSPVAIAATLCHSSHRILKAAVAGTSKQLQEEMTRDPAGQGSKVLLAPGAAAAAAAGADTSGSSSSSKGTSSSSSSRRGFAQQQQAEQQQLLPLAK
jgi:hypothetical protein